MGFDMTITPRPKTDAEHRPLTVHRSALPFMWRAFLGTRTPGSHILERTSTIAGARCGEYSSCTVTMQPSGDHLAESDIEGVSIS